MFFVRDASDIQISTDRGLHVDFLIEDTVEVVAKVVVVVEAKFGISETFFDKRN
jgi:hypothetical protein